MQDIATVLTHTAAGMPLIGSGRAKAARKNFGQNGHAVLTNERLVFGKGKTLKKMAAGESVSFEKSLEKGDIAFDIVLAEITAITQGKQGLSAILNIETNDGTYKFAFMKKAQSTEWEDAINSARGK